MKRRAFALGAGGLLLASKARAGGGMQVHERGTTCDIAADEVILAADLMRKQTTKRRIP